MSKTIVFFGNERLATGVTTDAPLLKALLANGYQVAAVVTNYEPGQSRKTRDLEIAAVAKEHHIPLLLPDNPGDILEELADYHADAGVLAAYGKLVPESVINLFPAGIINLHPSLLPLHRGPTPIENAILGGEPKTGVSIMALAKDLDAGPVYGQSELPLNGHETKQGLVDELANIGTSMLVELLPDILAGSVVALPQDASHATFDDRFTKEDGLIDWHKPAIQLEREIRAYSGWPQSRTTLADKEVVITQAHVVDTALAPGQTHVEAKQLIIGTGQQALVIDKLKPAGKPEMTVEGFLAGYKQLL